MYSRLLDMNNLNNAYLRCRKGVYWKESIQKYEMHRFKNLNKLRNELLTHTYKQKGLYCFYINERGKTRYIQSLHISDRILQRALCDYVLMPELQKYLIYDNPASVKGKGIDFARKRVKRFLQSYIHENGIDGYVLQIDFTNYFGSIPHDKFIEKISDKICDKEIVELVKRITDGFNGDIGYGIGSQLSQVAGIFYLTDIDNYCKIIKRVKYYERYMDDILIIHKSKQFLKELLVDIKWITEELGLKLNVNKTHIKNLRKGFVFLQMIYRFGKKGKIYVTPCKKSIRRERRKIRKLLKNGIIPFDDILESYKSWRGNARRFNSYNMIKRTDLLLKENCYGK